MLKKENKQCYVIVDCETGGLNPLENPITEIAILAVDKETFKEVNRWETFVRPYAELDYNPQALKGTGITLEMINGGKLIKNVVEILIKFFLNVTPPHDKGRNRPILVGHNVGFDIRFIAKAFELCDKELYDYVDASTEDKQPPREGYVNCLDTYKLARELWRDGGKLNLTACCKRIGVDLIDGHRAMADVVSTWRLLEYLIRRLRADTNVKNKSVIKIQENNKEISTNAFRKSFQF